jgi:hypothetical protein
MHYVCATCGALGPPSGEGWHVQAECHNEPGRCPLTVLHRCGRWVPAVRRTESPVLEAEMNRLETEGNPNA